MTGQRLDRESSAGDFPSRREVPVAEYPTHVKLRVGEAVVYGNHGIGRLTARKTQTVLGEKRDVVVIQPENDLSVTLPIDLAETQLRPLVSEADLKRIREALRDDSDLSVGPWLSRRREKLTGATRCSSPRSSAKAPGVSGSGLPREASRSSAGEREIFNKARTLVTGEIALARAIKPAAADGWIDEQLARAV